MEVLSLAKYNNSEDQQSEYKEFYTPEETALVEALSKILEGELRKAKRTHLSAGEVLLPNGLTHSIAQDMFQLADTEPCGLRGCILYINFEADEVKTKLSMVKCDPMTPSTFELYLTLKQSTAGWNSFLPQFLKNFKIILFNCCQVYYTNIK
ncbi:protein charybde isoform X2 [Leptinotarsa decemlineata]|uniref:protein charybde isoform X2 n=1 Tax=Leptinotarsa decemlineata TaxID=7539 RepID=UPI000C2523C9|nr:protein charybde-like isoform X2 [Leptinotarsa decemlineata]